MKTSVEAVAQLVKQGAAFVREPGGMVYTVGLMRQTQPEHWFWWESGVIDEFGGHAFRADQTNILYDGLAVEFALRGKFVGYLTTLEEAMNDETAVTESLVALREWRALYERSESLRALIETRAKG